MTEFYEGPAFTAAAKYTPGVVRTYIPIYLQRGGQVYFITNKLVAETNETLESAHVTASALDCESIKASFLGSGCRYYKGHGIHENPLHLMDFMTERAYTFTAFDMESMFWYSKRDDDTVPFTIFHGNLNEISAAFSYTIYDDSIVQELKSLIPAFLRQRPGAKNTTGRIPGKPIKTYADWQASGLHTIDQYIHPGDRVDSALVEHFRNLLSPITDSRGMLQAGGEASQVRVKRQDGSVEYLPTFLTFVCHGQYWTFCGICFKGDTVDMTGIHETTLLPDGSYTNMRRLHDFSEKEQYDRMFEARKTPDLAKCKMLAELCIRKGTFNPLDCALWDDPAPDDRFPYGFCALGDLAMLKLFFQYGNWSAGTGVLYHDLAFVNQVSGVGEWWTLKYDHIIGQWVSFESINFYQVIQKEGFQALMERLDTVKIPQCISRIY